MSTEKRCPKCGNRSMISTRPDLMRRNKLAVCTHRWHFDRYLPPEETA